MGALPRPLLRRIRLSLSTMIDVGPLTDHHSRVELARVSTDPGNQCHMNSRLVICCQCSTVR